MFVLIVGEIHMGKHYWHTGYWKKLIIHTYQ